MRAARGMRERWYLVRYRKGECGRKKISGRQYDVAGRRRAVDVAAFPPGITEPGNAVDCQLENGENRGSLVYSA